MQKDFRWLAGEISSEIRINGKFLFIGLSVHKIKQAPSGRELSPKATEGEGDNKD